MKPSERIEQIMRQHSSEHGAAEWIAGVVLYLDEQYEAEYKVLLPPVAQVIATLQAGQTVRFNDDGLESIYKPPLESSQACACMCHPVRDGRVVQYVHCSRCPPTEPEPTAKA